MNDLKKVLKSILVSSPARLQVYQLNEEYKSFVGRNIPFEEYGYRSLIQFLHSLSDVFTVHGNDLFSLVEPRFPIQIRLQKKKRRKRNRSKLSSTNPIIPHVNRTMDYFNQPHSLPLDGYDSILSNTRNKMTLQYTNESEININMHNKMDTEVDYERVALIKRRIELQRKLQENKIPIEAEKKELRYPKTIVISEKNEVNVAPLKTLRIISQTSNNLNKIGVLEGEIGKSNMMEYIRNRGSTSKRLLTHIPGKKIESNSIPTEPLVDMGLESPKLRNQVTLTTSRSTSLSLLDEPIPPFVPKVPLEFIKSKSDDLIDFDAFVEIPRPSPVVIEPSKSFNFMDVLKLVESLDLSSKH